MRCLEVRLSRVDAVLGEEQRHPVPLPGHQPRQGREPAADRVRDAVAGTRRGQRAQGVFQQPGRGDRVVQGGPRLADRAGPVPHRGQDGDRPVPAQERTEPAVRRVRAGTRAGPALSSTTGTFRAMSWREASKEKLSLGRLKATNALHACKAWLQRSVHILRGWLSGAVAWLQQLWPTITDAAIRFWHWILTPFQKTAP